MLLPPAREFIAFDFETTGLLAETDRIVEIGAVRFEARGEEIGRFQCLVNPERPMSSAAFAIHGLSDLDLAGAPTASEVLPAFLDFLGDSENTTLIAHNASFDAGFLGRETTRTGLRPPSHSVFDTLALARRRLPEAPSFRLSALAQFLGLDSSGAHRALADSLCVKQLWLRLYNPTETLEDLVSYRVYDPRVSNPIPQGWDPLVRAMNSGAIVQIEYAGGSRGSGLRSITPRQFVQRGGATYVIAYCHLDSFEKSFRLDRIRCVEIALPANASCLPIDRSPAHG